MISIRTTVTRPAAKIFPSITSVILFDHHYANAIHKRTNSYLLKAIINALYLYQNSFKPLEIRLR